MEQLFHWLSNSTIATSVIIIGFAILVSTVVLIYLTAFFQGREISFWPPKVGPKPIILDPIKPEKGNKQRIPLGPKEPNSKVSAKARRVAKIVVFKRILLFSIPMIIVIGFGYLFWNYSLRTSLEITHPRRTTPVNQVETIRGGSRNIPKQQELWVVIYSHPDNLYYPHSTKAGIEINGDWRFKDVNIGASEDVNQVFDIIVVLANEEGQTKLKKYLGALDRSGLTQLPEGTKIYDRVEVRRR